MKSSVTNFENDTLVEIELAEAVFGLPVRKDILARMVNYQLNKRRTGNHKTKQVWEVSGTTKKPYKQKGTGHARQGSLRSAQFRGGGIIFGPVVRSHATDLPKKVRKLALKTALSAKLAGLGWGRVLIIDGPNLDEGFRRAAGNIPGIDLLPQQGANVYDILRRDTLVLTRDAVQHLEARLK